MVTVPHSVTNRRDQNTSGGMDRLGDSLGPCRPLPTARLSNEQAETAASEATVSASASEEVAWRRGDPAVSPAKPRSRAAPGTRP